MENLSSLGYNIAMPKPLPDIDLQALCLDLEQELNYSPSDMAERLAVSSKAYLRWRSGDREPSGQPAIKLSLLIREIETKTGKKFSFKLKEN